MAAINLTSTTGSGFLETDFDQIKDCLQDGTKDVVCSAVTSGTIVLQEGNPIGKLTVSTATVGTAGSNGDLWFKY